MKIRQNVKALRNSRQTRDRTIADLLLSSALSFQTHATTRKSDLRMSLVHTPLGRRSGGTDSFELSRRLKAVTRLDVWANIILANKTTAGLNPVVTATKRNVSNQNASACRPQRL